MTNNYMTPSLVALAMCVMIAPADTRAEDRANASRLIDRLPECLAIVDDSARLKCLETVAGELVAAREKKDIVVLDREEVKKTKRSLFGFSLPKLPFFSGKDESGDGPEDAKAADEQDDVREITSRIVSFRTAGYQKWTFTLEDGSEWVMIEPKDIFVSKGSSIRIERGGLGNFRASIDGKPLIRVKRVG